MSTVCSFRVSQQRKERFWITPGECRADTGVGGRVSVLELAAAVVSPLWENSERGGLLLPLSRHGGEKQTWWPHPLHRR